jgi:hypothetical protein
MKKTKSTRQTKNMMQTAVWLPRDVHERLKKSGGDRGMGDEIRRLLQASLEAAEPIDAITDQVIDQIKDIARDLSRDKPLWADPFTFDVFQAAVNTIISIHEPNRIVEAKPEMKAHLQATWGDKDPKRIGRIIAVLANREYARKRAGQSVLDKLKDTKETKETKDIMG